MMKRFHVVSLTLRLLPFVLFFLLSGCGEGDGANSSSLPPGLITPVPEVVTPVASGKLLPVQAATIQTENARMTMAVNPQNNDVYIATLNGESQYSLYTSILVMRPDNFTGLLSQIWMVDKVQGLQWVTQIRVDPAGRYIYFYGRTNGGSGGAISVYLVSSNGIPLYMHTTSVGTGNIFDCCFNTLSGITLTPDGRYIYGYYPVSSTDGSPYDMAESVTAYAVDQDAQITLLDSVALPYLFHMDGSSPSVLHTVVASNRYVYIQHRDGSGISTYSNTNGKLTLVSDGTNVNTNNRDLVMALDPVGKFLYAAAVVNNQMTIYVHRIAVNGSLEIVNIINGINGGGTPFDMTIDSSNRYLYLFQSNGIGMYRIDIPGEILVPLGMQSTYKNRTVGVESPGFFAMNTSGKYLYTLGLADQPTLSTYLVTQPVTGMEEQLLLSVPH